MRTYLLEVAAAGRLELIESLAHPDMVDEANLAFGGPLGREGLIAHVKGFRKHIVDFELNIHEIVAQPSEVMAWWSFQGRHVGPWLGVPATNEQICGEVFSFFTLCDNRIQRYRLWLYTTLNAGMTFDSSHALRELTRQQKE